MDGRITRRVLTRLCACLGALALASAGVAADVTPLPVESFYRDAAYGEAELSPSGRQLAVTVGIKGKHVGLAVIDLEDRARSKVIAHFENTDVSWFTWVNDEHLLLTTLDSSRAAGEQPRSGWISIRADGSNPLRLGGMLYQVPVHGAPFVVMGHARVGAYGQLLDILP